MLVFAVEFIDSDVDEGTGRTLERLYAKEHLAIDYVLSKGYTNVLTDRSSDDRLTTIMESGAYAIEPVDNYVAFYRDGIFGKDTYYTVRPVEVEGVA